MCIVLIARKPYKTIAVGRRDYGTGLYKLSTLAKNLETHSTEISLLLSTLTMLERFEACTNISSLLVAPLPRSDPNLEERKIAKLWHAQLRHLNYNTISEASKQALGIPELPLIDEVCKPCQLAKHTKVNFSKKVEHRAT